MGFFMKSARMFLRLWFTWLVAAFLVQAWCVPAVAQAAPDRSAGAGFSLAMFIPRHDPFWDSNVHYAQAAADKLGIGLEVLDFRDDPAVLLDQVARVCRDGADGVIFQAFAGTGEEVLRVAGQYQTPALVINTEIDQVDFTPRTKYPYWLAQMTPDDTGAGRTLIRQLLSIAKEHGVNQYHVLGIEGQPVQEASVRRRRGLEEYVAHAPGLESFVMVSADWNPAAAAAEFKKHYFENPAINIVWCANDNMALAVADAVDELGIGGLVFIGGVDWDMRALKAIGEGRMQASVGGHFIEGAWAVLLLYDYLMGRDFTDEGFRFHTTMPAVTRANLEAFSHFLTINPSEIDFRNYSKVYNPLRREYNLDLAALAEEGYAHREPQAVSLSLTPEEQQWLADHPVINIGVDPGFAPFEFIDTDGSHRGMAADYLDLIESMLGLEFKVASGLTWSEAVEKAKKRELDILPCVGITEERKQFFTFTDTYLSFPRVLFCRTDGPKPGALEDLAGLLIGVQDKSSHHGWLTDHTQYQPILYPTAQEALLALSSGDVGVVVGNLAASNYLINQLEIDNLKVAFPLPGGPQDLALAVRNDWPVLVTILNKALEAIPVEKAGKIRRKWLGLGKSKEEARAELSTWLTPEENKWLADHSDFSVAVMKAWPPLDFVGPNGRPTGIGVDIIEQIAARAGLEVRVEAGAFEDNLKAVKEKKIDALMDVTPRADREEYLNFTKPYLTVPHVIVAKSYGPFFHNEEELKGRVLALEKGFGNVKYFKEKYPEVKVVEFADTASCLKAVSQGQAEAYAGNRAVASYIIAQELLTDLRVQGTLLKEGSVLAIGVRKDQPVLASILDKALATLTLAEIHGILSKWAGGEASAVRVELTAEEQTWLKDHHQVRVAGLIDFPPFHYVDGSGNYTGIAVDMLKTMAGRIGFEIIPEFKPWAEGLAAVREKRLDLLPEVVDTPERRSDLAFTKPFLIVPHALAVKQGSPVRGIKDLEGRRLALERGYYSSALIKAVVPQVEIQEVETSLDALKAVRAGQAEAYLGNVSLATYLIEHNNLTDLEILPCPDLEPLKLSMGVRQDWAAMIPILEKGLNSLTSEEKQEISRRYVSQAKSGQKQLVLTDQEKAWLKAHPKLRLGVAKDWPPFEFFDDQGRHAGITSEYVGLLNRVLGVTLEPQKGLSWSDLMATAQRGEIDIISCIARTRDREEFLNFTEPYLQAPLVVVTRKDADYVGSLDMLAGKTVAVVRDYAIKTYLESDHPKLNLLDVNTPGAALLAVSQGRAEATLENVAVLNYLAAKLGLDNLKVAAPTAYNFDLSFAVGRDQLELAGILDKALASISEKDRAVFQARWVNFRVEHRIDWSAARRVGLAIAVVAALILGIIVWWNRRLAREVRERALAEHKIQAMSEAVHDALIMIDAEARVMFWNHAAETIFGYSAKEVMGRDLHELFAPEELREAAARGLRQFALTGLGPAIGARLELTALRRDGKSFPVEVAVSAFQIDETWYAVGTVRDITDKKRDEKLLRESESRLDIALTSSNTGLWDWYPLEGRDYHNDQWYTQLGYTRDDFTEGADHLAELMHPEDAAGFQAAMEKYTTSQMDEYKQEFRLKAKDGSWKWILSLGRVQERDVSGRPQRIVGVHLDMTERKKAEQELKRNLNELERFSRLVVGREKKMIRLKEEVNDLLGKLSQEPRYKIVD
jgi:PAS domain S-box-containing protein